MHRPGKISNEVRREKNRSGKEACEICGVADFLEEHHIRGRDGPDANHPSNLANICARCHTSIHMGVLIVEGRVMTTDGPQLVWHKKGEDSFTGDDAKPYQIPV